MGGGEEKTENATPKKRQDERKKGHVAMSKDVISVATLFGSIVMLRLMFGRIVGGLSGLFSWCFSLIAGGGELETVGGEIWTTCVSLTARTVGVLLIVTVVLSTVATMAQTRGLVSFEPIKPKFEKISPLKGIKRLFSLNSLVETLKNLLKITVLLFLVYTSLSDMMSVAERFMRADLDGACVYLLEALFSMLLKVAAAFLVVAAADYGYQWWHFEKEMKMTKQEVKEEFKQMEGDPKVKGKIKEIQRKMAQSRMMQQVPQADVVVRNPTHFAVALRYHPGEDAAPIVLAMGQDHLALRIVEVAQENGVTVVENVPLARALYATADLNRQIPADLYEAVAEVMVYLFKLGKLRSSEKAGAPA